MDKLSLNSDTGFEDSAQFLIDKIKPFAPEGGITDAQMFFQLLHDHGWGTTNPSYMNERMGATGAYWLVQAAMAARADAIKKSI